MPTARRSTRRSKNLAAGGEGRGRGRSPKRSARTGPKNFHGILSDYRFLPAGRILAGAGTARTVTLFNCFVMGAIPTTRWPAFSKV